VDRGHWNHEFDGFFTCSQQQLESRRKPISFGTVDFQPHPPTFTPVFASLEQETDLTFGSLNFHVSSSGSIHLLDLIKSDLSARKTAIVAMSKLSLGSSCKVNSPVSFATTENIEDTIEELDEIMGNLNLGEASSAKISAKA
jgi:hypothetical protein